jgi:hypothetical protein
MERSTASSRFSFHRTGPRCPTSVFVHDDDDDDVSAYSSSHHQALIYEVQ